MSEIKRCKSNRGDYLPSLTACRYIAAMGVVLHHSSKPFELDFPSWLSGAFGGGVSFFFVLSGFVLTVSHGGIFEFPQLKNYYFRRASRILPLYWFAGLVAIAVWIGKDMWHAATRFLNQLPGDPWTAIGLFFTMLQSWVPILGYPTAINGPSWSLSVEMFFYLILPGLLMLRTGWLVGVALPIALGIVFICTQLTVMFPIFETARGYPLVQFFPPVRMLEFLAGILAARFFIANKRTFSKVDLLLLVGLLLLLLWPCVRLLLKRPITISTSEAFGAWVMYCGGFFFFALGIVILAIADRSANRGVLQGLLWSKPMQVLGNASFAMYLLHIPLRVLVTPSFSNSTWGFWSYLALVHLASVAAYFLLEVPAQRALNRWWRRYQENDRRQ